MDRLKLEPSTYEGPTGIVGVLTDACARLDIPHVSYWAAVPHYVAQPPCPKATLALVGAVEELLEANLPLGELIEDARAWERGVDELAEEDADVAEYVRALEETRDTAELPEASGEAIAREFERYLKRTQGDESPGPLTGVRRARRRRVSRTSTGAVGSSASPSRVAVAQASTTASARGVQVVGQAPSTSGRSLTPGRRPRRRSPRATGRASSSARAMRSSVHSQSLR